MLTIAIGVIAYVAISAAIGNGEIGAAILGIVIVLVLIGMAAGERKDARAWRNRRDYWADGGPDRRRW